MRPVLALLIAVAAVAVSLPTEVAPWAGALRRAFAAAWPAWTTLLCLALALAGRLLPAAPPDRPGRDASGMAVGLLLVLEPFLHLGVLALCATVATRFGAEALLPAGWNRPSASWAWAAKLAVLTVVVPVCEEFFFRGRLLPWLHARLGAVSAVSITALAFAVAHGDLVQVAVALPVGVLLGVMRLSGADLGACMLAHAVHNGLFLLGGPGLVAQPWIGPVMAGAGAALTAFAWFLHHQPQRAAWWRALLATALAGGLVLAALPLHRALLDRWYVAGTHRLLVWWRIGNPELFARLLTQERNGRLPPERRAELADRLHRRPCQTAPRQAGALAVLAPGLAPDALDDDAFQLLAEFAAVRRPSGALIEAARRVGLRYPEVFASIALEYPEATTAWLALPEQAVPAAAQLVATTDPHDRKLLLGALEQAQRGRVAAALLALPAEAVTPIDRRHLRRHYADAEARLAALAAVDPARAVAWGYAPAAAGAGSSAPP